MRTKITFSNKEVIKNLFVKRIEKIDLFKKKFTRFGLIILERKKNRQQN